MGLITSSRSDGSFSLRVRALGAPPQDYASENAIDGMTPPSSGAVDFFFRDAEASADESQGGFKPVTGFKPSPPLLPDSSVVSQQPVHYYPGKPTGHFDLTYHPIGHNLTIPTDHGTFTGEPEKLTTSNNPLESISSPSPLAEKPSGATLITTKTSEQTESTTPPSTTSKFTEDVFS